MTIKRAWKLQGVDFDVSLRECAEVRVSAVGVALQPPEVRNALFIVAWSQAEILLGPFQRPASMPAREDNIQGELGDTAAGESLFH